ncbi:MAG TPA: hypothetical protein EYN06_01980, partial [Myxococcales bacterium]|nr:hypothetical protein [Myxococcales bacterium]
MNTRYLAAFVTISASAHMGGCTTMDPDDFDLAQWESQLNAYENACLLEAVNNCDHDFDFYDKELQWDRRAAEALIDFRNGSDHLCGTSDDALFTDFADVDTIPFVGPVAAA